MITRRLVQPAYKSIRFMDILNFIPVSLDLKTGQMLYEGQLVTRILHNVLFYSSVVKCLQITFALIRLLINFEMRSLHVVILTALWLSLMGTSTFWGSELFHSGLPETIILFNSLEYASPTQLGKEAAMLGGLKGGKNLMKWVVAHVHLLLSLDLQEFLCVMTPFAVKLFVPMYVAMMTVFPHWSIFATSLVHNFHGSWWLLTKAFIVVFEILTGFYCETNILFLFFFQLALQVTHFARIDIENQKMR